MTFVFSSSFAGDCDNFDPECGKSLTLAMCTAFKNMMAKKCQKCVTCAVSMNGNFTMPRIK